EDLVDPFAAGAGVEVERVRFSEFVDQSERLEARFAFVADLFAFRRDDFAAQLPDHRPDPPGRVLVTGRAPGGADHAGARVRQLDRVFAKFFPAPAFLREGDPGFFEELLVVDDGEVFDQGGDGTDLAFDRRRFARRLVELAPFEFAVFGRFGEVE